jgi:HEAT repeat protein
MSIIVFQREKDIALVKKRFHEAGIPCQLSDIAKDNYTETMTALLLELFHATSDPMVRSEIGRKLQLSKSPEVENVLLEAFVEDAPSGAIGHDSFRFSIAGVLESRYAKKSSMVHSYLAIVKNKEKYGRSRQMLVLALAKMKDAEIDDVLISLLEDEDVSVHAIVALGKRRVAKAASLIRPFESHARPLLRKEAAKALRKIER